MPKLMSHLNPEEIEKHNEEYLQRTEDTLQEFKADFDKGICNICGNPFSFFEIEKPCMHWLMLPEGFEKKHFPMIYNKFNFSRLRSFLRWIANLEAPMVNINDLREEKSVSKFIEETIKYKNTDWSFSCDKKDFRGHKNSVHGKNPHYHFQMRIDSRPFIDYADFHLPLLLDDQVVINIERGVYSDARYTHGPGASIQDFMDNMSPEELVQNMTKADEDSAAFHLSTIVEAENGHTISGDDLAEIFEERKRTGKPIATLLKSLKNTRQQTIITPSENLPDLAARKKKKR